LIGELVGLLAISVLNPNLKSAGGWARLTTDELSREASLQVLPDGTGAEQSFAYSLFTSDLFLTAEALMRIGGLEPPPAIGAALRRAGDAITALVGVGESDPAFGDDDGGRTLVLDGEPSRTSAGIAAGIAAAFGHATARRLAETIDPTALLLFGRDGSERFAATQPEEPPPDAALLDGGVVVLRRGRTRVLFDVGPLGYLRIAAHGHADALQLSVSCDSQELVSDPGTGSYFGDADIRTTLRGTTSHATVSVDGLDQSEQAGPFMWGRHARSTLVEHDLAAGIAVGEHDGYAHLDDPVAHRRALLVLDDGAIVVVDRLLASASHAFDQAWPLHPHLRLSRHANRTLMAKGPSHGLVLAFDSNTHSDVVVEPSFWSRQLEAWEPTSIVRHRVTGSGTVVLGALLVPFPATQDPPDADFGVVVADNRITAAVTLGGRVRTLQLSSALLIPHPARNDSSSGSR
jgi:hypothetical protein